ncbi:zf-HC2 domain-containing protein [Streptomyces lavendulocolor]|uniref:zf-HC2 domain-containing protein n=1 Tax=Streptomyces lavendulocolor TaxID=67316 RepID=UPI0033CEB649
MPMPAAGCGEIRESLGVYVVGALEPDEEAPIRAHLLRCPACRSERDDLARVVRLLRTALLIRAAAAYRAPIPRPRPAVSAVAPHQHPRRDGRRQEGGQL